MKIIFPKLSGDCKNICWCFPLKISVKQFKSLFGDNKKLKKYATIFAEESLYKPGKKPKYSIKFGATKIDGRNNYLCSFRIEESGKKLEHSKEINRIFKLISKQQKRKIPCVVCTSFEFSLKKYKPLLEIPIEFTDQLSKKNEIGRGWISGIKLEFKNSKTGIESIAFSANIKKKLILTHLRCNTKFKFDYEMPMNIFKYARNHILIFYGEVKRNEKRHRSKKK